MKVLDWIFSLLLTAAQCTYRGRGSNRKQSLLRDELRSTREDTQLLLPSARTSGEWPSKVVQMKPHWRPLGLVERLRFCRHDGASGGGEAKWSPLFIDVATLLNTPQTFKTSGEPPITSTSVFKLISRLSVPPSVHIWLLWVVCCIFVWDFSI